MAIPYETWDIVTIDAVCKAALTTDLREKALEDLRGFIVWIKETGTESAYPLNYLELTLCWLHAYKLDNKTEEQRISDYIGLTYNLRRRESPVLCPTWILISACLTLVIPIMVLAAK
jgi:hypothetical protein